VRFHGSSRPLFPGDTDEELRRNRRVEINVGSGEL